MKSTKVSAVGAIALAAASVLGLGVAAYAVDVPIDDIGVEGDSYPADQWFFGEPVGPAATQDETGLTIEGQNQLLYGWLEGGVTAEEFEAYIEGASVDATGTYTFQVPVFFDPDGDDQLFTTLRPATTGAPLTSTDWISSRAIPALGVEAGTPVPFATILDVFDLANENGAFPEVLAFGIFVGEGDTVVLNSVTWGGEVWNFATPVVVEPEPEPEPAPLPDPIDTDAEFTG